MVYQILVEHYYLFFLLKKVNSYLQSLYNIHYFYFLLALSQLIILFLLVIM